MRKHALTLIAAAVVVLGSVIATPVASRADGSGSISGQLIDQDSGSNAPAVGVSLAACAGGSCTTPTASDANGYYNLTGVPSGTWAVVTQPPTPCGPTDFGHAQTTGITVSAGLTSQASTIYLTRAKSGMAGHIYGANGQALSGVSIFADNAEQGGNGYDSGVSDANGWYDLGCLPAARGYFLTTTPAPPYSKQADSQFNLVAGQTVFHDVHLSIGTASISGRITCGGAPCGPGVPNLLILEFCGLGSTGLSNPCSLQNTSPDTNGNYTAYNLQPGSYTVHVFAIPGWDSAARFNVTLLAYHTTTGVNVDLVQGGPANSGRITGHVWDAAGANYSNCRLNTFSQLTATPPRGQGFMTGMPTNQDGIYDSGYFLTPGGQYRVWLDCPGHPEVTTNVDMNGQQMSLSAGQTRTVNFFWPEPARPYTGGSDAIGAAAPGTDAYFAEGYTGVNAPYDVGFHEYLTVQNPNATAETLRVDYLLKSGGVITKDRTLDGLSRTTINVNQEVGPNQEVSAHLYTNATGGGTFVAERPMYFEFPGGINGGDDVMGAQTLGTSYYFAEGYTGSGFREFLTLMNPNSTDTTVNVTYFFNGQGSLATATRTIPAHSRVTVDVNAEAGAGKEVSVQVTSANAGTFLAERPIYFNWNGLTGGSVVVGAAQPSTDLNLAEGHTGDGFSEFLTMLNPGATIANVTLTYNLSGGAAPVTKTFTINPGQRLTRFVNWDFITPVDNSIHLHSDQPIVAERPMYFTFAGRTGGHDAVAVPDSQLGTTYNFAEGFTNSCRSSACFDQFFTILNNTTTPASITLTYYLQGGGTVIKLFTVAPQSRYTRVVAGDLGNFTPNSAQISSAVVPILVERPMYFAY